MAGQGAGPSRRSHTKSRKGCKTCKRRHIRCDENFPQCRNCTKHQVRCDYMENLSSDSESQPSPEQPTVLLTPSSESRVDIWQQTGGFPFPELHVFPQPQTQEYSKNELRLIEHLSAISNELLLKGTSNLTIWTQKLPKFLSIASSYPYVMHALLSFSANHLAWVHGSSETRNLHIQHGGIALRGLHEAIGNFSHANADAVLAASLLMLWQATDLQSWSSLRAGIQSVLSAMHSWKYESLFAEYIAEEDLVATALRTHRRQPSINPAERATVLQNTTLALQRLQMSLRGQELELHWINQLLTYVHRLQTLTPPKTAEEQFSQLYYLRKWLFWVPISLLQRRGGQGPAMLTLSYFYATALALEPLFPDLGSSFCSAIALPPLEAIINVMEVMQSQSAIDATSMEISSLLQFPRQTALGYRASAAHTNQMVTQQPPPMVTLSEMWSHPSISVGNISPAFAPSTPHYATPQSGSSTQSPWLEVPTTLSGFSQGTQSWGMASPGFPSAGHLQDEQLYGYMSAGGFRGGSPADEAEAGPSQQSRH